MLFVRSFKNDDLQAVLALRGQTIQTINSADYQPYQIEAWIGQHTPEETERRLNVFNASYTIVAEDAGKIVGYANLFINQSYLDQLYVAADYQKKGAGIALLNTIEQKAKEEQLDKITVESSITAKGFFIKYGYTVILEQQKAVNPNITLTNYILERKLNGD